MGIVSVAPSCVSKVGGLPSDAGRVLVEAQHQQQQQQQQRLWRLASCRVCDPKAVGRSRRGRSYGSYGALPNSSPISSVNISSAQIVAQRAISVSVSLHVFLHSCVPSSSSSSSRNYIAFRSWNRQISPALRLASVWTRSVSTGAKTWLSRRNGIARSRSGKRKQGATAFSRLRNNASPTAAAAHSVLSNKNSKFCCDVFDLPSATTLKVKKKQRQGVCCRSSSKVVSSEAFITPGWTPSLSYEQAIRLQAQEEESLLFRNGPPPGDIAEVEAFCRIHRLAELLHAVVMGCLRSSHNLTTKQQQQHMSVENDRDVPVLEEKVVAGLARMGAVLQQGRLEVLGGGRHVVNNVGDAIPSLARMRVELMDCCEALQKALELCFAPVPESIHRPMQQLHNVCLDAGFPRLPGSPSHADIPNFAAVKLRPFRGGYNLDQEEEVAFWRGGQMTVEGLEWLLQQGFKVVVDMRVEQTGSLLTQRALQAAEDSGLLRIVKIPVSLGMVPTMEQVKEFAMLVADADNKPLYLHSQRGVGRACAMVSRWREFVLHQSVENILNGNEISTADDVVGISRESGDEVGGSAVYSAEVMQELTYTGNELMLTSTSSSSQQLSSSLEEETPPDALEAGFEGNRFKTSVEATSTMREGRKSGREAVAEDKYNYEEAISWTKNVFEAQRPGPKVFCRKSMSEFTKRRKSMPGAAGLQRGVTSLSSAIKQKGEIDIAGPAGRWGLATPGIPRAGSFETPALSNGSLKEKETQEQKVREDAGEQARVNGQKGGHASTNGTYIASVPASSRSEQEAQQTEEEEEDDDDDDDDGEENAENGGLSRVEPIGENGNGNGGELKGDMCASTTGVVRVQSRRKAEMYLVRTDGFSCTRERVKESTLAFTHPSTQQQMLMWKTSPKTVLLLKKLGSELMEEAQQVASFLFHQEGMNVMVEPDVHDMFARLPGYGFVQTFYNHDTSELHERVDFVVCLGGDGVILHASNLFRNASPPVVSFNLGSLGFLTAHPFEEFKQDLRAIINGNSRMGGVYITLRMRLRCELLRNGKPIPGKVYDVLNEVVVDRGSNPYLCKIECYERSRLITKVQADGVLVATPTGSTAYSTAAGGSMVHPNVPCMLFTPICPHSLSFRPVILPDSALLELKVPDDARSNAWVSFDGKKRQQLCKGESVRICMSEHPMPTVNKHDQTDDWFGSLSRCFGWNQRIEQRSISFLM